MADFGLDIPARTIEILGEKRWSDLAYWLCSGVTLGTEVSAQIEEYLRQNSGLFPDHKMRHRASYVLETLRKLRAEDVDKELAAVKQTEKIAKKRLAIARMKAETARLNAEAAKINADATRLNTRLYFIREEQEGHIKIGISGNPNKRLQQLQTSSPIKLTLLKTIKGDAKTETGLHKRFKTARLSGEWFSPVPELLQFIDEAEAV